MKRLWLLAIAVLFLALGCTASDKAQMDDALRDARGDNMEMRYGGGSSLQNQPSSLKPAW